MKVKQAIKKGITNDFNKNVNQLEISERIHKKERYKSSKRFGICIVTILIAIVALNLHVLTNNRENNNPDDSYFFTRIHADEGEYQLTDDAEIKFTTGTTIDDRWYSATYDFDFGNSVGAIMLQGVRLNFTIEGENINNIRYEVHSGDGQSMLYRGVSEQENLGEEYDIGNTIGKYMDDMTIEDKQAYLDAIGMSDIKVEDLSDKEYNDLYWGSTTEFFNFTETSSLEDSNRLWSHLLWNITQKNTTIEVPVKEQGPQYGVFIFKHPTEEYMDKMKNGDREIHIREPFNNIEQLVKDTTVTIYITYKNGITHTKDVSFNTIPRVRDDYEYVDIECIIK